MFLEVVSRFRGRFGVAAESSRRLPGGRVGAGRAGGDLKAPCLAMINDLPLRFGNNRPRFTGVSQSQSQLTD